jgi:hypothetical protein
MVAIRMQSGPVPVLRNWNAVRGGMARQDPTLTRLASAIELLQMDLDGAANAAELVKAIAVKTPTTELAIARLRRWLPKLGEETRRGFMKSP